MVTTKILFCFTDSLVLLHKIPQGLLLSLCLSLSLQHTCAIYLWLFQFQMKYIISHETLRTKLYEQI